MTAANDPDDPEWRDACDERWNELSWGIRSSMNKTVSDWIDGYGRRSKDFHDYQFNL